jgi:IPT/TIG domain
MLESRRCVSRSSSVTRSLLRFAVLAAVFCPSCLAIPWNPVPYIDIVSPASVHPGVTGVTLTVFGANFVNTSTVKWNGISLTTAFVSSKKLTAAVPNSFVAAVGLGAITVVSPSPGGGISNVGYRLQSRYRDRDSDGEQSGARD